LTTESESASSTGGLDTAISTADLQRLAAERMTPEAWDYVAGGAEDEVTLGEQTDAFRRWRFVPRVLVDVGTPDLRTTLLGREVGLPIGVAPVAAQGLAHPDGELATARAAAAAGAMFCLSTVSSRSIEEVAAAAPDAPKWFQLYVNQDVRFTRRLVERAEAAGYEAIVLTVDLPVLGYREREKRRGWELDVPLGNFAGSDGGNAAAGAVDEGGEVDLDRLLDMRHVGLTWDGLAPIRSWTSLPLVIKGILHPDDARLAVEHGAAGVWVSTHGGRQLDRSIAALDALPGVVAAVGGRAEVYVDGGVRRGSDALIALALGARAVFTGRPFIHGLGAGGEAGVARAFTILREELERAMSLLGTPTLADVRREHLAG
jgi:4-hydroxymandelate oxidase